MSRETTGWFRRSFSFENIEAERVVEVFRDVLLDQGFKIRKESKSENGVSLGAMFGSKLLAFFVQLIPFVGRHFPSGKRLYVDARLSSKGTTTLLNFHIVPYMELIDDEEIPLYTQNLDEKASDEYYASLKAYRLTKELYSKLGLLLPEEFGKFDIRSFATDTYWRLLLYPLDSFNSSKPVFTPPDRRPSWSWGAFIIPEIWFIWHEIWGPSMLVFLIELFVAWLTAFSGINTTIIAFPIIRIFCGIYGHTIYYRRYGRWLKQELNHRSEQTP